MTARLLLSNSCNKWHTTERGIFLAMTLESIFGTNLHRRAIPKYSSILDQPVAHFHPLGVLWRWQRRPHFHLLAALILQISSYSFNLQSGCFNFKIFSSSCSKVELAVAFPRLEAKQTKCNCLNCNQAHHKVSSTIDLTFSKSIHSVP